MPCKTCGLDGHIARSCPRKPAPTEFCVYCHVEKHHVEECAVRQRQIKDANNLKAQIKRDAAKAFKPDEGVPNKPSTRTVDTLSRSQVALKRARDLTAVMSQQRADSHREKNVTGNLPPDRLAKKRKGDTTGEMSDERHDQKLLTDTTGVMPPDRLAKKRIGDTTDEMSPERHDQKLLTDTTGVMPPDRLAKKRIGDTTDEMSPERLDHKRKGDTAAVMPDVRHDKKMAGDRVETMSQERADRQRERKRIFGMPLEAVAKQVTKNENRDRKTGQSKTGKLNFAMKRNKSTELNFDTPIVIIIFQILLSSTFHY
jgi:hypothetical protein